MVEFVKEKIDVSFEKAVEIIKKTGTENGYMIIGEKNLSDTFAKKLGINDYPNYAFILVCNPKIAKQSLDVSKNTGILFPCSYVMYEEGDDVFLLHISIMKLAKSLGLADARQMEPIIEETSRLTAAIIGGLINP